MKLDKDYQKKIIIALIIVVFIFSCRWIYKEWGLHQWLIREKGEIMGNHYHLHRVYLNDLENITAEIILTRESPDKVKGSIGWLNELYWGIRNSQGYYRYGYFKEKIEYWDLKEFIRISNKFLKSYSRGIIKLNDKNMEVLKNINRKAKELNDINKKYYKDIEDIDTEDLFYSDLLVRAVNEMNDSLKDYPEENLDYDVEYDKENLRNEPKLEDIYGSMTLSEDEAKKIAEKFLGKDEFGEITTVWHEDEEDLVLRIFGLRTENNYDLEIYGEKITELKYEGHSDEENTEINISKEDAVENTMSFLSKRGFDSLQAIKYKESKGVLEIDFAEALDGYINSEAEINAKVDLTREGQLLELELTEYWKGLLYDDSGYDTAIEGYEKSKKALKEELVIKEEKLVGRRGDGYVLDFYWRFTTEFDGYDYYIYVDAVTGEEKDVSKVLE